MTILDQIKERVAHYVGLWNREPKETLQHIETLLTIGGTAQRIETPLVTCKDCKHEYEEWGYPYCCRIPAKSFETHGDNFCGFAVRREA